MCFSSVGEKKNGGPYICYDVIKRKSYVFLCTIFGVKLNDERFKMMGGGEGSAQYFK